jgi:hypothetical protein
MIRSFQVQLLQNAPGRLGRFLLGKLILCPDVQTEGVLHQVVFAVFVLADALDPFPDFFSEGGIRARLCSGFLDEHSERLSQLTVFLGELLDHPVKARLALPHHLHVAILLLKSKMLGYVRLRCSKPSMQLVPTFRRGRMDRLFQGSQIREKGPVGPAEGLADPVFCVRQDNSS